MAEGTSREPTIREEPAASEGERKIDLFPLPGRLSFTLDLRGGKEKGERELEVLAFTGEEGISRLYWFEVELAERIGKRPGLDWSQVLGLPACLGLHLGKTATAPVTRRGIVSRVVALDRDERRRRYRVRVEPRVWRLEQNRNCRIFQNRKTFEIVQTLLEEGGVRFGFDTKKKPRGEPRGYCVQYQESDWTFIRRLLEEEGWAYYFVHGGEGEELRIVDDLERYPRARPSSGKGTLTLRYRPPSTTGEPREEHVAQLGVSGAIRPGRYSRRDQIFEMPWLQDTQSAAHAESKIEVYEYVGAPKMAPDTSADPDAKGSDDPALRLEELRAERVLVEGRSSSPRLVSGHSFQLRDLYEEALAEPLLREGELLVTRLSHQGAQSTEEGAGAAIIRYGNSFACLPRAVPFRPSRVTARPTIPGAQSAVVVGPAGEEVYTDKLGRVKVQFPWDRYGKLNQDSSCWVPVSQPWAGTGYGTLFIPRVGHQVIVQFLDGDPDQPIVIGEVYHLHNPPPEELPKDKTVSTIRTDSSPRDPKRLGFNQLRFEDRAGGEEVRFRAQRNRNDLVRANYRMRVGHDARVAVKRDYAEEIGRLYSQKIGNTKTVVVAGDHFETIEGAVRYLAQGPSMETIKEARVVSVGSLRETVKGFRKIIVERGNAELNVKAGEYTVTVQEAIHLTSELDRITATARDAIELRSGPDNPRSGKVEVMPDQISLRIGAGVIQMTKMAITLRFADNAIHLGEDGITIEGKKIKVKGSSVGIDGKPVRIN